MTSSSDLRPALNADPALREGLPEPVIRAEAHGTLATLPTPELRTGGWTRLGDSHVLGDRVTEDALAGLAEQTRVAAQAQGYAVGWAEGRRAAAALAAEADLAAEEARRAAEERREAEHRAALAALARAAQEFQTLAAAVAADLEDAALGLARELTDEIVGHAVRAADTLPEESADDVVRRTLAVLPAGVAVTLRVHPRVLGTAAAEPLAGLGVHVVGDAGLGPLDAVLETPEGLIDLRVAEALRRVREVLA